MNTSHRRVSRLWLFGFALLGLGTFAGCISDDADPEADDDATGGSSGGSGGTTGGSSGTAGSNGGTAGTAPSTKCAAPTALPSSNPGIATFDEYDGDAVLKTWYFALGGDSSIGVQAGPFGYGDHAVGTDGQPEPEFFRMVDGTDSTYALSISDTEADEYGGGMGLWLSNCLDATAFSGISFWIRGDTPMGNVKLSVFMEETTSNMPAAGGALGTCPGIDTGDAPTCVHPSVRVPVTDTWTEQRIAWSGLSAGLAAGTPVVPDGHNIWQIQIGVELIWVDDGTGVYVPTPAPYEVAIDTVTFY
jgi:hypothetical protein